MNVLIPEEILDKLVEVAEYVSRGRMAAFVGLYPDATARRALGKLSDFREKNKAEPEETKQHIIQFSEHGWTIMHPVSERPNLFACPLNMLAEAQISVEHAHSGPGRYYLDRTGPVLNVNDYIGP